MQFMSAGSHSSCAEGLGLEYTTSRGRSSSAGRFDDDASGASSSTAAGGLSNSTCHGIPWVKEADTVYTH